MDHVESIKMVRTKKKPIENNVTSDLTSENILSINDKDIMDEPTITTTEEITPVIKNTSFEMQSETEDEDEEEDEEEEKVEMEHNKMENKEVKKHPLKLDTTVVDNYQVSPGGDISEQHLNLFNRRNGLSVNSTEGFTVEEQTTQQDEKSKALAEGRKDWPSKVWVRLLWLPTIALNYIQSSFSPQTHRWNSRIDENIILGAFPVGFNHALYIRHLKITHVISLVEDWELSLGRGIFTRESLYRRPIKQLHVPVQDHWGTLDMATINRIINFMNLAINGEVEVHDDHDDKTVEENDSEEEEIKAPVEVEMQEIANDDDDISSNLSGNNEETTNAESNTRFWTNEDKTVLKRQESTVIKVIDKHNTHQNNALKNVIYIHCKSGRGRSAMVVACYLIKKYNWTAEEAVIFLKSKRPVVNIKYIKWKTLKQFEKKHRVTDLKKLLHIHNIRNDTPESQPSTPNTTTSI